MTSLTLSAGLPETVLDPEPQEALEALIHALRPLCEAESVTNGDALTDLTEARSQARDAVSRVLAEYPTFLDAWAQLGRLARDDIEAYAAFRVGYHRGLDRLRSSGWRGSGYVRWQHDSNRGFLRALHGLAETAAVIGESNEAKRCELFLEQLDPNWPPNDLYDMQGTSEDQ